MDYNAAALEMHAKYPGKLIVNSLFEVKDRDALSTAYTPGVAEPCRPKLVCRSWKASAFCLRSSAVWMRSPSA